MRTLASVVRIRALDPIPDADEIAVATVKGWQVVIRKGEFEPGDLAIYFEIDSLLPICPQYEFLRKSSYRRLPDGSEGFRLRTVKLRGQISQGLLVPLTFAADEGTDVTEKLGILKYEPPMQTSLSGQPRGLFPSFIPKTDEVRIQNIVEDHDLAGRTVSITEKLDGCSATFYLHEDQFGVCSRNLELQPTDDNAFWIIARQLDLESRLRGLGRDLALQGELIGPGIQGNGYRRKTLELYLFNVFDIATQYRAPLPELLELAGTLGLMTVPVVSAAYVIPSREIVATLLKSAEGLSRLADVPREGIVLRTLDGALSCKAISNSWLLKHER
jgi:RNA ligase (TIGR02306 family)